ncbi:hypothetical protein, partial [Sulfuricurvum sp.]|uniref:calcium-binding protein n=1 Tax=Sulfuricurvum sp. TaxID=2025608 RepID=UPI0025E841FA
MALSGTHTNWVYGSYEADRNDQIKISENHPLHDGDLTKLNVHIDGKDRLALAYGYDLLANINTLVNDLSPFVTSLRAEMNVTQALEKVKLLVLNSGNKTKAQIRDEINSYITLGTEENATLLLNKTVSNFETALDKNFGSDTLTLSRERAAVISQIYRLGSGGAPSLMKAIKNNNRAESWFQIRFNSNADELPGNYIRVVAESDMFGLYDAAGVTEVSAKEVMRMYLRNKSKIIEEQNKYPTVYDNSDSIINQISHTRDYLIAKYGEGINIDGDVQVGKGGSATYDYLETNYNDTLTGTAKNDLIFGERGSDSLNGGAGDDILIG